MNIFVFYLNKKKPNEEVTSLISIIFNIPQMEVGELLEKGSFACRFELKTLDYNSDFNIEVDIYVHNINTMLDNGIYNNLNLAIKVSECIHEAVLINDESDDPYQWILVNENKVFLVEAMDNSSDGINLNLSSMSELSIQKSLELLPKKDDIIGNKLAQKAYYVQSSDDWKKCLV